MNERLRRLCQTSRKAFLLLVAVAVMPSFAQDMKPLSSILAKSIAASGRKTVAVVDFTDLQGNVTELGRFLAEELSVDLVGDAKGFEVIERNQLRVILQEHQLSATGLIDPQTARKLGQFAGVDALVTGTLTAFGDTVRLSAKVLDTQTAKMLGAATSDIPRTKAIEDLLQRGISQAMQSSTQATQSSKSGLQTGQPPLAPKPTILSTKAVDGGNYRIELVFTPKSCSRHRQEMTCRIEVMNKGETGFEFRLFGDDCSLLDEQGNQYKLEKTTIGQRDRENLEPEIPINIVAVTDNVSEQARRMTLLLSFRVGFMNNLKTAVRNIPVDSIGSP